jgi:hypothetical protein
MIGDTDSAARQAVVGALNSIGSAKMPERIQTSPANTMIRLSRISGKFAGYFGYADCAELLLQCCDDENERSQGRG